MDIVENNFRQLSGRLSPVRIKLPPSVGGFPRPSTLVDLRVMLLKRQTCRSVKDAVWSSVIRQCAVTPNPWAMAAAGMFLPGLKRIAARFAPSYPNDVRDLDSEVVEAFLQELRVLDPAKPRISSCLYTAVTRRAQLACARERRLVDRSVGLVEEPRCPCRGNPDVALAKAVLDGVITCEQAQLVCEVHLDCRARGEVAQRLGLSRDHVRRELATARRQLSAYLVA